MRVRPIVDPQSARRDARVRVHGHEADEDEHDVSEIAHGMLDVGDGQL